MLIHIFPFRCVCKYQWFLGNWCAKVAQIYKWNLPYSFRSAHIHREGISCHYHLPCLDTEVQHEEDWRRHAAFVPHITHPSIPDSSHKQRTQTRQFNPGIKRVNNVHMVSAPEGTILFYLCELWAGKVEGMMSLMNQQWIMKHNTAFCNRKNKRWDHQQAREERVKESKQWLNDQKLAERVSVSLQGTLIYPQVKVRFQAQCNYSWGCQFDINAASRNSLIGLRGESEPENILTF